MSANYYYWLLFQIATAQTGPCFFFVQTPFDTSKQFVLRVCAASLFWVLINTIMYIDSCLCNIFNFLSNNNSLSQSASSWTGRCHFILEAIQAVRQYWCVKFNFICNHDVSDLKICSAQESRSQLHSRLDHPPKPMAKATSIDCLFCFNTSYSMLAI